MAFIAIHRTFISKFLFQNILRHNLIYKSLSIRLEENKYFQFFKPLLWPSNKVNRILVIISLFSVFLGLIVNLLVPIYSQKIVDDLSTSYSLSNVSFSYETLWILLLLKTIQGVGSLSLLNCFQNILWIRLEQNSRKTVQVQFFNHLHSMSLRWQLDHKTSDILGTLERGSVGATSILEHGLYTILPTVLNIILAILYLSFKFNLQIGLLVLLLVSGYILTTIKMTEWRSTFQKSLNTSEDEQRQKAMESLMNFETVKLFNNQEYEQLKFERCINLYNNIESEVLLSLNALQLVQLAIVNLGILAGSWIILGGVLNHNLSVGDYVLFASYMGQLILPLNYFGMVYRSLRVSFTNLKSMMEIMRDTEPKPGWGKPINIRSGEIEFRNVSFRHAGNKQVLESLSFTIPAKKTFALVGASGAGKSTLLRLLTKLYDPDSGEILIDGQNIREATSESLYSEVGVVPQDTILFHDSVKNNIKYAKLDATDEEIIYAAKCAQIHNKISSFPEGYNTLVGERGMKLSGGEKQRIAISRVFVRNPRIVILDEATSSLDVHTESEILSCFTRLCRNRTSLIVTHRLQSIENVDKILFLKGGKIVESGSHSELIALKGEYYSTYRHQLNANSK